MAHREGVVHRNLSRDNILLVPTSQGDLVKIRDFGLSRLHQAEQGDAGLTAAGTLVGTTEYMSPEYVAFGQVDYRVDLYALGCLLFEMVVGHPPYTGGRGEVLDMHVDAPIPHPRKHGKCPKWMDELIVHLLAKEPRSRPKSGEEVKYALEQGVGHALDAPDPDGGDPGPSPIVAFVGSAMLGFITVTALGLLAIAVGAGVYVAL
jgi:serine/threonine-protein kinase